MLWLPYRKFDLESPLSPAEVSEVLEESVAPKAWFQRSKRPFEGVVSSDGFEIQRIISYKNSFLPCVRGQVAASATGSRLSVTMQPRKATSLFLVVWTFVAGGIAIDVLRNVRAGQVKFDALLGPAGMLLFVWVMAIVAFAFEAKKAERRLTKMVEGSRVDANASETKPPGFF